MNGRLNVADLVKIAETLSHMSIDDLSVLDPEVRISLEGAIERAKETLKDRAPELEGENAPNVYTWGVFPADDTEASGFSQGPAASLEDIGFVPEGHVIVGMSYEGFEIIRGKVRSDMSIDWGFDLQAKRQAAADQLFEQCDLDHILDEESHLGEVAGWESQSDSQEWGRSVFVETGTGCDDTVQMHFAITFADRSSHIISARFDSQDVAVIQDKSWTAVIDNENLGEIQAKVFTFPSSMEYDDVDRAIAKRTGYSPLWLEEGNCEAWAYNQWSQSGEDNAPGM